MIDDFADPKDGGFFYTAGDHESLIARPKDPADGVLPGANSVAVRNLVALAAATGEPRYLDLAGKTLSAFSDRLARAPYTLPLMLVGLEEYLDARPSAASDLAVAAPKGGEPSDPLGIAGVVTASAQPATVAPGSAPGSDEAEVVISLNVKPGWHVYANPTGVEGVPPTRVTLDPGQGMTIRDVAYPAGVAKVLGATGAEKVALYEGKVALRVRLRREPGAKPPAGPFRFTVSYQACNDRACLAPARLKVESAPSTR
jgi:hypothetical protein